MLAREERSWSWIPEVVSSPLVLQVPAWILSACSPLLLADTDSNSSSVLAYVQSNASGLLEKIAGFLAGVCSFPSSRPHSKYIYHRSCMPLVYNNVNLMCWSFAMTQA